MKKVSRLICAAMAASLVMIAVAIFVPDSDVVVDQPMTINTTEPAIRSITVNDAMTVANGGAVSVTGNTYSFIGLEAEGEVLVQNGGTFSLTGGNLLIGCNGGTGVLTVATGGMVDLGSRIISVAQNTSDDNRIPETRGTLNVSGTVKAARLELTGNFPNQGEPRVEAGVVNLEAGGVLQVNSILKNDRATSYIHFNGGTLRFINNTYNATEISNDCELHIIATDNENAIFETACDYVVINDTPDPRSLFTFSGNGTLIKRGPGHLAFRIASNTFSGDIIVEAGTLDLGRPLEPGQTVTVWAGAAFLLHEDDDPMAISYLAPRAVLYTPSHNVSNLNLVAATAFYDDAVGTPFLSSPIPRLSGTITHNAGTALHPFRLVGQGGTLEFEDTGLEDDFVVLDGTSAPGTFNFFGDRTLTPDTTNRLTFLGPVYYGQVGSLTLNGADPEPLDWRVMAPNGLRTWGLFSIGASDTASFTTDNTMDGQECRIGGDTNSGDVSHGTLNVIGGTTTFQNCIVGVGNGNGVLNVSNATLIVNGDLQLAWGEGPGADSAYRPYRPTGFLTVGDKGRVQCNLLRFTPMWPSWEEGNLPSMSGVADATLQAGSVLEVSKVAKNDTTVSTLFFDGGILRARGSAGDFAEVNWPYATLSFAATPGNMIDIDTQWHRIYFPKMAGILNLTGDGGFRKRGSGTLGFNADTADYPGDTVVDDGTLILLAPGRIPSGPGFGDLHLTAPGSELALGGNAQTLNSIHGDGTVRNDLFRFIRLKLEGPRDPLTATSIQLAELELYSGEDHITPWHLRTLHDDGGGGTGTNPTGNAYPPDEEPYRAVDGDPATKWNDFRPAPLNNRGNNFDRAWLRLEFEAPLPITAYRWITADDRPENDPADWRLQGSMDAEHWFDLDIRTAYEAPTGRGTPTEFFTVNPCAITPPSALGILADGSSGALSPATPLIRPEVPLRKLGNGELTLSGPGTVSSPLTVESGTVRLTPSDGYRFYRFKIEAVRNPFTNDGRSTQLSEIELYDGPENVTPKRTAVHYDPTGGWGTDLDIHAGPEWERADFAVDGNTNTKWNDFRISRPEDAHRVWIVIEFPRQQPLTAYRWATANDAQDRDPAAWRLQASDNGDDWTDLDIQADYDPPWDRFTYTEMFPLSISNDGAMPIAPHATVALLDGTALILDGISQTLGGLGGTGTVTLNADATLALNPPPDAPSAFYGTIGGQGSLLKQGPGTQQLLGTNTFSGDLTVQGGILEVGDTPPYTWFRLSIKRKADDTPVVQLSELALYSADSARRNLGLRFTPGQLSTRLAPGECSVPAQYPNWTFEGADLLFDDDTGTKFCTTYRTPLPGDPSSWYVILMRLPDGTPEITHYNLATANDSAQFTDRNPTDWTLEASPDGTTWFLVDERTGVTPPGQNYAWYSNIHYALTAARAAPVPCADCIPPAATVAIAPGATLTIGNPAQQIGALAMDLDDGAGTLTHLNPLPGGALYLTGGGSLPPGSLLPLTVLDMSAPSTLATWTVHIDGTPRPGLRVTYDVPNAQLRLTKGGTILMIR